jgi:peptidoglycan-associated lipoprotein
MKRTLIAASVLGILLSACSTAPQKTAETTPAPAPTSAASQPAQVQTQSVSTPAETEAQKLDNIIKTLASNSIYFDFDKFTIKPEYMDTIKRNYELLSANPQMNVQLQGNCDDRGSAEYNIALGQKRADAVRKALIAMGIKEAQLSTISYGKEKPRCTESNEKCWAENRRVDFSGK